VFYNWVLRKILRSNRQKVAAATAVELQHKDRKFFGNVAITPQQNSPTPQLQVAGGWKILRRKEILNLNISLLRVRVT
jgi:hypothetical protein